jgi:hypothetical protein
VLVLGLELRLGLGLELRLGLWLKSWLGFRVRVRITVDIILDTDQ